MRQLILAPGEGLSVENPVGGVLTFKITGDESGGALTAVETVAAPQDGPPLHAWGAETRSSCRGEFVFVDEAFGARTGARMTLIPSFARRASKAHGNFASRSWMRNCICQSRSWSSISRLVQARYSTRRLPIERKTSTYRRWSETVSTVKKSQARIDSPCARRRRATIASGAAATAPGQRCP
jgi:hypothetical protein